MTAKEYTRLERYLTKKGVQTVSNEGRHNPENLKAMGYSVLWHEVVPNPLVPEGCETIAAVRVSGSSDCPDRLTQAVDDYMPAMIKKMRPYLRLRTNDRP